MQKTKKLELAPVIEALAQINFEPSNDHSFRTRYLASVQSEKTDEIARLQFDFNKPPNISQEVVGHRIVFDTGKRIEQLTNQYMAFSALGEYSSFEQFEKLFALSFKKLIDLDCPKISSCALRFVNKFDLPPNTKIEQHLKIYPCTSDKFSAGVSKAVMSLELAPRPEIPRRVLNQVIETIHPDNRRSVTLDIDVSAIVPATHEIAEILARFQMLRKEKNELFESVLTEVGFALFSSKHKSV